MLHGTGGWGAHRPGCVEAQAVQTAPRDGCHPADEAPRAPGRVGAHLFTDCMRIAGWFTVSWTLAVGYHWFAKHMIAATFSIGATFDSAVGNGGWHPRLGIRAASAGFPARAEGAHMAKRAMKIQEGCLLAVVAW